MYSGYWRYPLIRNTVEMLLANDIEVNMVGYEKNYL